MSACACARTHSHRVSCGIHIGEVAYRDSTLLFQMAILVLNHLLNNPSFPHWCEMTVIFLKLGFHTRYFPNKLNLTHYRPQYARTYYIFEVLFISPYTSNLSQIWVAVVTMGYLQHYLITDMRLQRWCLRCWSQESWHSALRVCGGHFRRAEPLWIWHISEHSLPTQYV